MPSANAAVYARYSSDRQSPNSISDQIRKCEEYAARAGLFVMDDHIYSDEGISGAGADRPGLARLVRAAESPDPPFSVVLVDDTSRLSRDIGYVHQLHARLNFRGIRVIAVSQNIDSQSEQAEALITVHSLMDSYYLKELAKKTHRGLEGNALSGQHTGGRCYGYDIEKAANKVQRRVNDAEARNVVRIFEMYAAGRSFKSIAKALNAEGVPPPELVPGSGPQVGALRPFAKCSVAKSTSGE